MRITTIFFILLSFIGSAQKESKLHPDNCIQIDSNTFFGQTEITNIMYHRFINYVTDSILTHMLYNGLPYNEAKILLNVSKKELKTLSEDRREYYAETYGLDYDKYKIFTWDSLKIALVESMYYPQPERYYKRREINVHKLLYKLPSGESVPIYPDTTCWVVDYDEVFKNDTTQNRSSWANHYMNMYFWHPAYDNYPVVGLSIQQLQAYCAWYERQLNNYSKDQSIHYSVSLPTIEDYQKAMQYCVPDHLSSQIAPGKLGNPILKQRNFNDAFPHIHPAYKDYSTSRHPDTASVSRIKQWSKTNATFPVLNLLGGPAEVIQSPVSESNQMTILGGDYYLEITDPNHIQANTLFYKRVVFAGKGYSTVGFRIVVTTSKIPI